MQKKTIKDHVTLSSALNVVNAIACCVHLSMAKPPDYSVKNEALPQKSNSKSIYWSKQKPHAKKTSLPP